MNLYLLSQGVNNGYETYDSAVVCAETEEKARFIHPDRHAIWDNHGIESWCEPKDVCVELIGIAVEGMKVGVVCASYSLG